MESQPFDPEGKYFGFRFESDISQGPALKVVTFQRNQLQDIWNPYDHAPIDLVDESLDPQAIQFLIESGIRLVYTPGDGSFLSTIRRVNRLYLATLSWDEGEKDWGNYHPLGKNDHKWFQSKGIRLEFIGDALTQWDSSSQS